MVLRGSFLAGVYMNYLGKKAMRNIPAAGFKPQGSVSGMSQPFAL